MLGLRWSDVNFERGELAVVRSLTVVDSEPSWSEPKTSKGRRVIALDRATVSALRTHRKMQNE